MNEDILKLIQTLYTEFYSWKSKLEQTKALESENIFDAKLKSNIASIEERMAEIKQFIKNLEDSYQEILNKSYEDTTEESITQIDILEIKEDSVQAVIALQNTMNDIISKNITIEKLAFEHAKKCIDSLNLNPEIGNDLVAYIFDRIIKEATDFVLTAFPFANEIIQIAQAIYSNSEIKIPSIDEATILTIEQKIIKNASNSFEISAKVTDFLQAWLKKLSTANFTKKEKRIKYLLFRNALNKLTIEMGKNTNFLEKANSMLVIALQELFQKANVPIIQWCAASVLNEPDPQVPIKTSFTKDEKVNKIILDTIAKIGIPITSTGALRPKYLQQLFPQIIASKNVIYVIHPDHKKSLAGELSDYAEKSPGAHYADNLKKMREQESWEEKLKKKEEEVWANAMQEKVKKEMEKEQKIYNQQKEELKAKIIEKVVGDKPYGMNAGMEFQLGKVYDIGATFGVSELDKWGNLDTEAAASRLKEFAAAIKKLNPKMIVYSAFLDNAHGQKKYSDVAVYTGLSQFHDSICYHSGLKLSKDLDYKRIHLLSSETELAKSRLGRFLEFN